MTLSDWISLLAVIVAVISAFIAWVYARRAHQSSDRANRIQGEILRIYSEAEADRKRDQRETRWVCDLSQDNLRAILTVRCAGPAPAEHVKVLVDGHLPDDAGFLRKQAGDPLRMVEGAALTFTYMVADGSPQIEQVTIEWDQPDGERQTFTTAVYAT